MLGLGFLAATESLSVVETLKVVKTIAGLTTPEHFELQHAARRCFTHVISINGHSFSPFFGVDILSDISKSVLRRNPDGVESDGYINAYYWYTKHLFRACHEGDPERIFCVVEEIIKDKTLTPEDIAEILSTAINIVNRQ